MAEKQDSNSENPIVDRYTESVVKSKFDTRKYAGLELANGIQVLLISDPDTPKSAAAVAVNIGSTDDPGEIPGLAHLCEHVLFMGSEKHPGQNDFHRYMNLHGGVSNAYTSVDQTRYVFDILPNALEEALDIFAGMFISPLFTEESIDGEINVIESEQNQAAKRDLRRYAYLRKNLASRNHEYRKFGMGSLKTLKDDPKTKNLNVREELIGFFKEKYSGNIMSLCVLGAEPLQKLADWATANFSNVENKSVSASSWTKHPFGLEQTMKRVVAVPVSDWRALVLCFPLPDWTQLYKQKPELIFMHLLANSEKDGLISILHEKGWTEDFQVDHTKEARGFFVLEVKMFLTESGLDHVEDIIELLFQYVQLIKKEDSYQWMFQQLQKQTDMCFTYKEKEDPYDYVSNLAADLREFPLEEALSWPYGMDEHSDELIKQVIEHIKPENMVYTLISKKTEGNKENRKEKWFGMEHFAEPIPDDLLKKLQDLSTNEKLKLPSPNKYLPNDLNMKKVSRHPVKIRDDNRLRIWHKFDDSFAMPKSCIFLKFTCPLAHESSAGNLIGKLLVDDLGRDNTQIR